MSKILVYFLIFGSSWAQAYKMMSRWREGAGFVGVLQIQDNRYLPVDTLNHKWFQAIGNFDRDSKIDLLCYFNGKLCVCEPKFPEPYPSNPVWQSDSFYDSCGECHVSDLDLDGKMDFLLGSGWIEFAGSGLSSATEIINTVG